MNWLRKLFSIFRVVLCLSGDEEDINSLHVFFVVQAKQLKSVAKSEEAF